MKIFHKCFFAILLFPFCSFAQSNYQPGLIVNLKGDTIRGKIDYKEWEASPKSILFKSDSLAEPQKFTVSQVKFFNVSVGHLAAFLRYVGSITTDNIDADHIPNGRDSSFKIDTIFLRVLQDGPRLKLFSYTDNQKTRFFVAGNFSEQPVELTYRMYWNTIDATDHRTTYETAFKGQLYDIGVKDQVMSSSLKAIISKSAYTEPDILEITSTINGISESDATKNNPTKRGQTHTLLLVLGLVLLVVIVESVRLK
jgi:hypothetical protein